MPGAADASDAVEIEQHRGRGAGFDPRSEVPGKDEESVLGGKGAGRVQATVHGVKDTALQRKGPGASF